MVMKKYIITCIVVLVAVINVKADNVSVSDQELVENIAKTVWVNLSNTEKNYVSFQMDLTLPDGISINKEGCGLTDRITDEDQELIIGKIGDNKYRLTSASFSLTPISGTKSTIINLSLIAGKKNAGGVAVLSNILFVTNTSKRVGMNDVSFNIKVHPIIEFADVEVKSICVSKWDGNNDGELDTREAASVVNLNNAFKGNTTITTFDEFQYFTKANTQDAFNGCSALTSIILPNVNEIGIRAFNQCSSLESVIIPEGVPSIALMAFEGCKALTTVNIPSSVTTIGKNAFRYCTSLTTVNIENGVQNIYTNAFDNCISLKNIFIPKSILKIESDVFYGCSLETVTVESEIPISISNSTFATACYNATLHVPVGSKSAYKADSNWGKFKTIMDGTEIIVDGFEYAIISETKKTAKLIAGPNANKVAIPSSFIYKNETYSVKAIDDNAFNDCGDINSIIIPNSITSIGEGAFRNCSALTSIEIPNSVTTIGDYAFEGCYALTSIEIPNSVNSIGNRAFYGCNSLVNISIEKGNTIYDSRENCNAIIETNSNTLLLGCKNTKIPNSVTSIGESAFEGCYALTSIEIPNSVTSIGENAFEGCSALTSIEIPNSVTSVGEEAFYGCYVLTSVTVNWEQPISISEDVFTNRANATLTVPSGSKSLYKAADYWKEFKEIIELVPQPTTDDYLSADALKMRSGETANIDILLNNEIADYTAYQFDLTLPEGFSIAKNKKDKWDVTKGERYEDDTQQLTVNFQDASTNTYRILCFSMSNGVIEDTEGCILKVAVKAGEDLEESDFFAKIKNVTFTCVDGTGYVLPDTQFKITINNVIPGDANGDGIVNVTDIVEMVNYIMNKPSDKFVFAAADVNSDGLVNVTDIVCTVTIIMSSGVNNTAPRRAETTKTYYDLLTLNSTDHGKKLALELNNESDFVAAQFDVRLSDGQQVKNILLNSRRTNGHALTWSMIDANTCRVLVYSLSNKTFRENAGELLQIELTGTSDTVVVDNITFVNSAMEAKLFDPIYGGTTGIQMMKSDEAEKVYYDLNGRKLNQRPSTMGVYIKNGQKYIVK